MNKLSHANQFLLPDCGYYCTAAPIPFDEYTLIPRLRPRQFSSAPWWCLTVPVPVRSGLKDMSITPQSRSMCSIGLDGFSLNIPGAAVHTFQWGGVLPAVSGLGCSNPNKDIINSIFRYSWFQFAHVLISSFWLIFLQVWLSRNIGKSLVNLRLKHKKRLKTGLMRRYETFHHAR